MGVPVFTRLETAVRTYGGTVIAWELNKLFRANAPLTFNVYASRSGVGGWSLVASEQDACLAVDPYRWLYAVAPHLFYKVILRDADGNEYESHVHQMLSDFNQHDMAIVRDMLRKETLRNTRYAGQHGYLLKRRRWGTLCTVCTDWDTGEVKNASCTTCYGTGFVGGYFRPVHYWVSPSAPGVKRRTEHQPEAQAVTEDRVRAVRGINCPWLDSYDVWVESNTDRRYFVHSVQEITYRDMAIIFDPIELRLAPATDIIYTFPLDPDSSSSSGTLSEPIQGNPMRVHTPSVPIPVPHGAYRPCNCR